MELAQLHKEQAIHDGCIVLICRDLLCFEDELFFDPGKDTFYAVQIRFHW